MEEKIKAIRQEIEEKIESFDSSKALYEFRKSFLDNKEGKISLLMKGLRDVPKEDRPAMGKVINEVKEWAAARFDEMDEKVRAIELEKKNQDEAVDVTMPAEMMQPGALHPDTLICNQLIDVAVANTTAMIHRFFYPIR